MTYYAILSIAYDLDSAWDFLYDAVVSNGIPRKQLFISQCKIVPVKYKVVRKITSKQVKTAPFTKASKLEWLYGASGKHGLTESTARVRKWLDKYEPIGVV